jgi:inorganic phosphate transporter, PiT family
MALSILLLVIIVALVFEFINGFHDTANSIATVVATKVLTPIQALALASVTNLIGALWGTAVAKTISSGLIDSSVITITSELLICALMGGIIWNLVTWYYGLPSSSSHALIGGLVGAAVAASHGNWSVVIWSQPADPWYQGKGILWKVVVPMVLSPLGGFIIGITVMGFFFALISWMSNRTGLLAKLAKPNQVNKFFGKAQIVSAGAMGFMHGMNDAQKTMGIIALALVGATTAGTLENAPAWLRFLSLEQLPGKDLDIPLWVKLTCAFTMAAGTAAGGWRIIKTLGHKLVKLQPIHGFAAETAAATMIGLASALGIPVSTTHNISAAILGVGAAKRFSAVKWSVVQRMVWAWILTLPISAGLAYVMARSFAL